MDRRAGFTLIELLIVLAILGVLVGVVAYSVGDLVRNADRVADSAQQQIVQTAIDTYITQDVIHGAPSIGARILPDTVGPSSLDAPFGKYLKRDTNYYYSWDAGGDGLHETTFEIHGAHFVDGLVNKAFNFPQLELTEGSRLYPFVHQQDRDSLDLGAKGTITAWIKPHSWVAAAGIVHKGESNEIDGLVFEDEAYTLQFHWNNSQRNRIFFAVIEEDSSYKYLLSDPLSLTDIWYHIVASWDESGMDLAIRYRDGDGNERINQKTNSQVVVARNTDGALVIGAQLAEPYNGSYFNMAFDGVIDEVGIHHRAWTTSEGQSYYDATKGN